MIRNSWRTRLKATASEGDILAVVGGFLGEWSSEEVSALPEQAWPGGLTRGADVLKHAASLALLHARFDGDASRLPGLQEMLLFFTHAAVRIAQVRPGAPVVDLPSERAPEFARQSRARRAARSSASPRRPFRG